MKFIDLFCGTGAFSHVLETNGHKCVFANDIVDASKQIYELNMSEGHYVLDDIQNVDIASIPKHKMLCAGFPCQPFSIAGKQKGFDDERSNVFWTILNILKHHKPSVIILENVKNLTSHDKGNTFKVIKKHLEELGYHLKHKVLDTCKITHVPQHRERIYIVGFLKKKQYDKFNFDFEQVDTRDISDFLENDVDNKYYYTDKLKVFEQVDKDVVKNVYEDNVIYQYRRYYVRENKNNVCPTLTANMGSGGHNVPLIRDDKGIRKLTPRECFNLQGFPHDYVLPELSDSKLYHLAGNAVSVPVVELIVNKINEVV